MKGWSGLKGEQMIYDIYLQQLVAWDPLISFLSAAEIIQLNNLYHDFSINLELPYPIIY